MGILHTMKEKMFGRLQRNIAASGEHIGALKGTFSSRMADFREHRGQGDQKYVAADFNNLLAAWGIHDERDIPAVCSELKLRLGLFILPIAILAALALWQQSGLALLVLACFAVPGLVGIATTLWRLSILQNRQFRPFTKWILGPLPL